MAAIQVLPYSTEIFSGIDDLFTSADKFDELGARGIVDGLAEVFNKYGLSGHYGLSLVHRHFDLKEDEVLVEFGKVALPCGVDRLPNFYNGNVQACAWAFRDGACYPYEFHYTGHGAQADSPEKFLSELYSALSANNVDDIFGVRRIASKTYGVEVTEGRANITLPKTETQTPSEKLIEAFWHFAESKKYGVCFSGCVKVNTREHLAGHIQQKVCL